MAENSEVFDARILVAKLSSCERSALLHELLAGRNPGRPPIPFGDLLKMEGWLRQSAHAAASPRHANSRWRMWFIFMLLRYGGLRLREIFALLEKDCDFNAGLIHVGGSYQRVVPLPMFASRRMGKVWQLWPGRLASCDPFLCDPSQVRRSLKNCAFACGLPPNAINATALRRNRARELALDGLHPALVNYFLGCGNGVEIFSGREADELLKGVIQRETGMKTSARNVFRGQITGLREHGILVEVVLATGAGLNITAIITKTSRDSLNLVEGKKVTAMVKAPWVTVLPENARASAGQENCFEGTVKAMNRDDLACEILVSLAVGNEICALYAKGASPEADVRPGAKVVVCFGAFAVILMED